MKRPPKPAPGTPTVCRGIPRGTKIVTRDVVGSALACSTDDRGRPVVLVGAEVPRAKVDAYMRDVRRRLGAPAVEDPRQRPTQPARLAFGPGGREPKRPKFPAGTRDAGRSTLGQIVYAATRPGVDRDAAARPAVLYFPQGERADLDAATVREITRAVDAVSPWHSTPAAYAAWVDRETRDEIARQWKGAWSALGAVHGVPLRVLYEAGSKRHPKRDAVTVYAERTSAGRLRVRLARDDDWTPQYSAQEEGAAWRVKGLRWPPSTRRGETDDVVVRDLGLYDSAHDAREAIRAEEGRHQSRAVSAAERTAERERPAPAEAPRDAPRHFPIVSELTDDVKAPRGSYAREAATAARRLLLERVTPEQLRTRLHTWGSTRPDGEVWYLEPGNKVKARWVRIDLAPGWSPLVRAHRASCAGRHGADLSACLKESRR